MLSIVAVQVINNNNKETMMFLSNILPLTKENFDFCLAVNIQLLQDQMETGDICPNRFWMVNRDRTALIGAGNHSLRQIRRSDDIIAATVVNAIAIAAESGVDAIRWPDDQTDYIDVECKLSYRTKRGLFCSPGGTLYSGNPLGSKNNRCSLRSGISAVYEIVNNLDKKNMETHFILIDDMDRELICAYCLDGETVIDLLSENSVTGVAKTAKKRSIKLSQFINYGTPSETSFKLKGLYKWEQAIRDIAILVVNGYYVVP